MEPLPTKWILNEKLPFGECSNIEFKLANRFPGALKTSLVKYRETLLGMLNVGGGYLILGVQNDGTIIGMDAVIPEEVDKLNVWVDTTYGTFMYKDGRPLDPVITSLKTFIFPVIGTNRHVVVIEAIHKGEQLSLMTKGGEIIYRLNASNYRIHTEPMYTKRDMQGMITAVQTQMQEIIKNQHQVIKNLHQKHKDELEEVIIREKENSEKAVIEMVKKISDSLYIRYSKLDEEEEKRSTWSWSWSWSLFLKQYLCCCCFSE